MLRCGTSRAYAEIWRLCLSLQWEGLLSAESRFDLYIGGRDLDGPVCLGKHLGEEHPSRHCLLGEESKEPKGAVSGKRPFTDVDISLRAQA